MARPERTKTTVAATATERAASDGSTRSPALTYTSAFQPSAPSPKTIAASTTATGPAWSAKANTTAPIEATTPTSTSVRTRRDPPPRSATEPHAMRAAMAATLTPKYATAAVSSECPDSRTAGTRNARSACRTTM